MHVAKEDLNPLRGSYERTIVRLGGLARMHALVPGAVPAAGVAPGGPAGVPCAQPLVGGMVRKRVRGGAFKIKEFHIIGRIDLVKFPHHFESS